jgi:hypothetical protein
MILGLTVWIALAVVSGYAVERLLVSLVGRRLARWALAPGIVVRELSHIVGCLVTGATITRASLFDLDAGPAAHTKPKLPVIGDAIIGLMPAAGCTLALGLAWTWLGQPLDLGGARLPALEFSSWSMRGPLGAVHDFVVEGIALLRAALAQTFSERTLTPQGLAFAYCLVTFSIAMAPGATEIKHALLGLLVGLIVVGLLEGFGVWAPSGRALVPVWSLIAFAVMTLLVALGVSVPAAALFRIAGK